MSHLDPATSSSPLLPLAKSLATQLLPLSSLVKMSTIRRNLSFGKDKKQPAVPFDVETLKQSISRPQNLAPRHILEEQIKKRKEARLEAEATQGSAEHATESSSHQPAHQPKHQRSSSQDSLLKRSFQIVFRNAQKCKCR